MRIFGKMVFESVLMSRESSAACKIFPLPRSIQRTIVVEAVVEAPYPPMGVSERRRRAGTTTCVGISPFAPPVFPVVVPWWLPEEPPPKGVNPVGGEPLVPPVWALGRRKKYHKARPAKRMMRMTIAV